MTLTTEDGKPCEGVDQGPFEPIAVIGLGALMPDAQDIDAFWKNILDAKVSTQESVLRPLMPTASLYPDFSLTLLIPNMMT